MIACVYLRCIIETSSSFVFSGLFVERYWYYLLLFPISPTIGCPNVLIALQQHNLENDGRHLSQKKRKIKNLQFLGRMLLKMRNDVPFAN